MTYEQIAAFWAAMTYHALRIWYLRTRRFYREKVRRYLDRYYRIGRHRPTTVGYQNLRWAAHLTAQLREEHQARQSRAASCR